MESLKCHPVTLSKLPSTPYELGVAIAKFRFDALREVFRGLSEELARQVASDKRKKRTRLYAEGSLLVHIMNRALVTSSQMLFISRPHMQHEFERTPEITD